jgi:hypothetical protein
VAKGGKIQHWKHGWIPLTPWAKAYSEGQTTTRPSGDKVAPPLTVAKEIQRNRITTRQSLTNAVADLEAQSAANRRSREARARVNRNFKAWQKRQQMTPAQRQQAAIDSYQSKQRLALQAPTREKAAFPRPDGSGMLNALRDDGGFTYDPKKAELLQVGKVDGIAVARPGTEQSVGRSDIGREEFADAIADLIEARQADFGSGAMLGGWYSEDRDLYMVEVTDIFPDRESAIQAGRDRNQEGIFDLKTGDFIPTGGTGDGPAPEAADADPPSVLALRSEAPQALALKSAIAESKGAAPPSSGPTSGPGTPFWPEGVPEVKDVPRMSSEADGDRMRRSWETAGSLLDNYSAMEPDVTASLVSTADQYGGRMEGLAHRLKTQDSLARKLFTKGKSKGLTPEEYGAQIGDALRYTMVAPPDGLAGAANSIIADYRRKGYTVEVENTWPDPNSAYKGINTNFIAPDGSTFELQFHTPESLATKNVQHDLYDVARSEKYPPDVRQYANELMVANGRALRLPNGVEAIG